jgi:Ca2+-binding RTX toxin-like protein
MSSTHGAGDDQVTAFAGPDRVYGGAGRNLIEGGAGPDWLDGGPDADTIYGGSEADVIRTGGRNLPGGGTEFVYGGRGDDTLVATDSGDDWNSYANLYGQDRNDTISSEGPQ